MSKRDRSANLVNWEIHFTAQELRKNKSFLAHTPTPSFLVRGDHNEIYQSPSPGPRVSEAIGGKGFTSSEFTVAFPFLQLFG